MSVAHHEEDLATVAAASALNSAADDLAEYTSGDPSAVDVLNWLRRRAYELEHGEAFSNSDEPLDEDE